MTMSRRKNRKGKTVINLNVQSTSMSTPPPPVDWQAVQRRRDEDIARREKERQQREADRRRVRAAFDSSVLKRICVEQDFSEWAEKYEVAGKKDRFYWHRDNGSTVLAVAHLDSVHTGDNTCRVVNSANGLMALSGALDDRLGAYVILDMLPKLGINVDLLLTTDEERGDSTASLFTTTKQYNHIIEFDRGGTDVVMYEYDTRELRKLVTASGAHVGQGSYSDICMLESLKCKALNWGVGYQDYHGPRAHAWLNDTFEMVGYYTRFHAANADTLLEHEEWTEPKGGGWYGAWRGASGGSYYSKSAKATDETLLDEGYCPDCEEELNRDDSCPLCGMNFSSRSLVGLTEDGDSDDEVRYQQWLEARAEADIDENDPTRAPGLTHDQLRDLIANTSDADLFISKEA